MSTIDQVLTLGGCHYTVYDMGRTVQRIDKQQFVEFEQGAVPYPYPIQGHACFAVVFSKPEQAQTPYLWLLKFAVDEVSKLIFSGRDDFLRMVIQALGEDIANADIDAESLNNHPYAFKPSTEKLAVLNARIRSKLHQSASIYYEPAYDYFCHHPSDDGWQALGFQGIADLTERLDSASADHMASQLEYLPEPAFCALAQCLEHIRLPAPIQTKLMSWPVEKRDTFWLRALTGAQQQPQSEIISGVLNTSQSIDLLITVCARHWRYFNSPERVVNLLESVVQCPQGDAVFAALIADLTAIPQCRQATLEALRWPQRSVQLSQAIGQLFQQVKPPVS
ncbi:hypothetical protein GCM10011369_21240 [Neiella marina]|uniref:DUF3549 family protein n=1 Tax=Neiella marina TaxID=508461 RepID=A0A8J2XMJ5_9GAMM|nr:DUF3549 family protein [Neiella marina]GGA79033.1 hypothetical protein GCM10011369_21240 [Neiella marina]